MASNEISARIKIDGAKEAQKDLQSVGKEAQKIDGETVELGVKVDTGTADRDIAGLLAKVDKLDTDTGTILLTSNATAIAGEIGDLILDLDRLDASDPQVDVKIGQIAALKADLDTIEAKIIAIHDVDVDVNADTGDARQDIEEVLRLVGAIDGKTASAVLKVSADQFESEIREAVTKLANFDGTSAEAVVLVRGIQAARGDLDQVQAKIREIDGASAEVDVTANTTGFTTALGLLPGSLSGLTQTLGPGGTVAAGLAGIGGLLLTAAGHAADVAKQAQVMSDLTGDSVEFASKLQGVWQTTGADVNDLNDVLLQMNGVLIDTPEYAKQLGINLNDGKTIGERFVEVVEAISQSTLGAAEKAKLMSSVFGEEGVRQVATLTASIDGPLSAAIEAMPDLIDEEATEEAKKLTGEVTKLKTEFDAAAVSVGQRLIPLLQGAVEVVEKIREAGDELPEDAKKAGFTWKDLGTSILGIPEQFGRNIQNLQEGLGLEAPPMGGWIELSEQIASTGPVTEAAIARQEQWIATLEASPNVGSRDQMLEDARAKLERLNTELKNTPEALAEADAAAEESAAKWKTFGDNLEEFAQGMTEDVEAAGLAMLDAAKNSEAFASALDRLNRSSSLDFGQMAQDTVASFDGVKEALDGIEDKADIDWSNFDITPDEYSELKGMPEQLSAVTDAVSGMRGTIQAELQAAFDTGGIQAYSDKADFFAQQIQEQFLPIFTRITGDAVTAQAQVDALKGDIGLLPEQKEIIIKLTREEQGANALEQFQGFIDRLPEEVSVAIKTKIAEGDIAGALEILNAQLIQRGYDPIVLPVDAELAAAQAKLDSLTEADRQATVTAVADVLVADGALADVTNEERLATIAAVADTIHAAGDLTALTDEERQAVIDAVAHTLVASGQFDTEAAKKRATDIVARAVMGQAEAQLNHLARDRYASIIAVAGSIVRTATGGTVPPGGGIAGEAGPEFVRYPDGRRALLTGETFVPPRTRVTSTRRTRELLRGGRLPNYANGTGDPATMRVEAVWEQILQSLKQLTSITAAGNETTNQLSAELHTLDTNQMSAEQGNQIASLLDALNEEMAKGADANQEAIDNLKSALSVAVRGASSVPVAAIAAAAPAEAAKAAEAAQAKGDPNTAILEKISNTLLETLAYDRTALSMTMGELGAIVAGLGVLQSVVANTNPAGAVRSATMSIQAGAA